MLIMEACLDLNIQRLQRGSELFFFLKVWLFLQNRHMSLFVLLDLGLDNFVMMVMMRMTTKTIKTVDMLSMLPDAGHCAQCPPWLTLAQPHNDPTLWCRNKAEGGDSQRVSGRAWPQPQPQPQLSANHSTPQPPLLQPRDS